MFDMTTCRRSIACLLLCLLGPVQAQKLAIGIKGGVRTSDDFTLSPPSVSSESKRYIVGPMLDMELPWHLGIEFDVLYRRFGYTRLFGNQNIGRRITRDRSN